MITYETPTIYYSRGMNKFCVSLLSLLIGGWLTIAQSVPPELQARWDKESEPARHPLLEFRPSHLPDRVIVTPLESNSSTLSFTWRTDTTVTEGRIEIIEGEIGNFPKDNREREEATYQVVHYKDYPMHYHTAQVTHLEPGKTYKYRVGNSPYWSEWFTFVQPHFEDTVQFLYFGDTQNGIFDHSKRVYTDAFKKFDRSQLAIYVGDLINHANNDYEWSEWHTATKEINAAMPVLATPGNHEYLKNLEGSKTELSAYWKPTFPYPYDTDTGAYFFDYGFVRFIVLNSNDEIYQQGFWLDRVLEKTVSDWVIIVTHHPVFSGAKDRENRGLQENWLPVIRKHRNKIALVLQGHDHTYARGGVEDRKGTLTHPEHPVFVISVIGDKYYPLTKQKWMYTGHEEMSTYQYIEMTRDKVKYRSFSETNRLIDEFVIER